MNINALYELRERLNASVIAGLNFILDDFRLARAIEQIEPLAKAAPIFMKIYETVKDIAKQSGEEQVDTILSTMALLDAVICTQGTIEQAICLEPLESREGIIYNELPYSELEPIISALTETGTGRLTVLEEAYNRNPLIIKDYRIIELLIQALSDRYSELADKIEEWLSKEDGTMIPLLKKGFLPDGNKEMVRRLHIIENIAGVDENDYYRSLLDVAKKEVKEAVIVALRHDNSNIPILLELVKTEKGNSKRAAQEALTYVYSEEVLAYWKKQLQKAEVQASKFLKFVSFPEISDLIADGFMKLLKKLLKIEGEISQGEFEKLEAYFTMIMAKDSKHMCELYYYVAKNQEVIDQIVLPKESKECTYVTIINHRPKRQGHRYSISELFSIHLQDSMIYLNSERLKTLAKELYKEYGTMYLSSALTAYLLSEKKEAVYEAFAPFLDRDKMSSKESSQEKHIRLDLMNVMGMISYNQDLNQHEIKQIYYHPLDNMYEKRAYALYEKLDDRWYDTLTNPYLSKNGDIYFTGRQSGYYEAYYYSFTADHDAVLNCLCEVSSEHCLKTVGKYMHEKTLTIVDHDKIYDYFQYLGNLKWEKCQGVIVNYVKQQKRKNVLTMSWIRNYITVVPLTYEEKAKELEEIIALQKKKEIDIKWYNEEIMLQWCFDFRAGINL